MYSLLYTLYTDTLQGIYSYKSVGYGGGILTRLHTFFVYYLDEIQCLKGKWLPYTFVRGIF
jgi:hypothetical protein